VGAGIASDASGNFYVTGSFSGTVDFGLGPVASAGNTDVFLMKLDPAGSPVWVKRFGILTGERGEAVAVDASGNLLLAGHYQCNVLYQPTSIDFGGGTLPCNFSDMGPFVAKLDPNGNHIWSYGMPSGDLWTFRPLDIAIDAAGSASVLVSRLSAQDHAMFVRKFDANGNVLWSASPVSGSTFGADGELAVDGAGNVIVAFEHAVGVGTCPCDYYVSIAKYDPGGALIWKKQISGPGAQGDGGGARGVAVDGGGNIFVAGPLYGNGDLDLGGGQLSGAPGFLAKLGPDGAHIWSQTTSHSSDTLSMDSAGNLVSSVYHFSGLGWTSKLDPSGATLWTLPVGARRIAIDPQDRIAGTGMFSGTADFGTGPLTSAGGVDGFVALISP
jgi:hypothetical protein